MISVSDADFIRTIRELGREEGLFTEPAGSVSVAALRYLVKVPGFENPGLTVCNLTGHGLNVPQVATDESERPASSPRPWRPWKLPAKLNPGQRPVTAT